MARLSLVAADSLRSTLDRDPVQATYLGDHARDGLLADPTESAARDRAGQIRSLLAGLDTVGASTPDDSVDAAVLRTALGAELFELEQLREAEWNPMLHNPGGGLHALLSRDFAPLPERLASVSQRLTAIPDYLDAARTRLGEMSRIHLETAVTQLDATISLVDDAVAIAERGPVVDASAAARRALIEHREWLRGRTSGAVRDPRIGHETFRAKLALALDTAYEPSALLREAEAELARTTDEIIELAGRLAGVARPDASTVREVLDRLADDVPTDATILQQCADAFAETTAFVREHDLVTVYDDPVVVVEMPEIDRGVAVAYCQQSGPLEAAPLPTEIAVSPTPAGWTAEQTRSFYREYNNHLLPNLMVHEAMPGHALQLMHANRYAATTPVRAVWNSGSFVEGWAVYSEELLAQRGYGGTAAGPIQMQQLKMRLRTVLNTIMDIRFHCDDLDEVAAMELMIGRGFQERGEADGKWRRVQLSSTQLCTYFVGYTEVSQVVADLRAARPRWSDRQVHDAILAHGSPPARHVRTLLGLAAVDD